jgi:chitinase
MKRHYLVPASFVVLSVLMLVGSVPSAWAQSPNNARKLTKRVIGDYGYWSRTQTPPYSAAQIPFWKLTQINHAGVSFNSNGYLVVPQGFLEPALISDAHAVGDKVLLLLGGDFPALSKPVVLSNLLANLLRFVTTYGYDGVDIDWEYPGSDTDRHTLYALMTGLRQIFPSPNYLLTIYVAPWGSPYYDVTGLEPVVDQFSILMYDCAGPWTDDGQLNSPIFPDLHNPQPYECQPGGSVEQTIGIWVNTYHVPPAQLNMGTPFYGYFYENVNRLFGPCTNCSNTVLSENYGTFIKERINNFGWETFYDPSSLVPYMLRTDGQPGYITYDDAFSTYYRVWYSVWDQGLGGSFAWALDEDYDGHTQDLLEAMYHASLKQPD